MQLVLVQNPLHSYCTIETLRGYLYKKFPEMWGVQKVPRNLHTSVLDMKRQKCLKDYGKSFVSMLILLVQSNLR